MTSFEVFISETYLEEKFDPQGDECDISKVSLSGKSLD